MPCCRERFQDPEAVGQDFIGDIELGPYGGGFPRGKDGRVHGGKQPPIVLSIVEGIDVGDDVKEGGWALGEERGGQGGRAGSPQAFDARPPLLAEGFADETDDLLAGEEPNDRFAHGLDVLLA